MALGWVMSYEWWHGMVGATMNLPSRKTEMRRYWIERPLCQDTV